MGENRALDTPGAKFELEEGNSLTGKDLAGPAARASEPAAEKDPGLRPVSDMRLLDRLSSANTVSMSMAEAREDRLPTASKAPFRVLTAGEIRREVSEILLHLAHLDKENTGITAGVNHLKEILKGLDSPDESIREKSRRDYMLVKETQDKETGRNRSGELIGEQNSEAGPYKGAKQYRLKTGEEIWQLPDGRIIRQSNLPAGTAAIIWAPRGSGQESGVLAESAGLTPDKAKSYIQGKGIEHFGGYMQKDGARLALPSFMQASANFTLDTKFQAPEALDFLNSLDFVPRAVEPASTARMRIIAAPDGKDFERVELDSYRIQLTEEGNPIARTDRFFDHFHYDSQANEKLPFRVYRILSEAQSLQLADLNERRQNNEISTSDYVVQLAELRKKAVPIAYPEQAAELIENQRSLRDLSRLNPLALAGPDADNWREKIMTARRELLSMPYNELLLPEEWGQLLDTLPNRDLVKELRVHPWGRSGANPSMMEVIINEGRLSHWGGMNAIHDPAQLVLSHEWGHLLEAKAKSLVDVFHALKAMNWDSLREYADTNKHEYWAVHVGEGILASNAETAVMHAFRLPLQTLLACRILQEELSFVSKDQTSSYAEPLQRRLSALEQIARPLVKDLVFSKLASGNAAHFSSVYEALDKVLQIPEGKAILEQSLSPAELTSSPGQLFAAERSFWSSQELAIRSYSTMSLFARIRPEIVNAEFLKRQQELETRIFRSIYSASHATSMQNQLSFLNQVRPVQYPLFDTLIDWSGLESFMQNQDAEQSKAILRKLVEMELARDPASASSLTLRYFDPSKSNWETAAIEGFNMSDEVHLLKMVNALQSQQAFRNIPGAYESLAKILHESNKADLANLRDVGYEHETASLRPLIKLAAVDYLIKLGVLNDNSELVETSKRRLDRVASEFKAWFLSELESNEPVRRQKALAFIAPLFAGRGPAAVDLFEKLKLESVLQDAALIGHSESDLSRHFLNRIKEISRDSNSIPAQEANDRLEAKTPAASTNPNAGVESSNKRKMIDLTNKVSAERDSGAWRMSDFKPSEKYPDLVSRELPDGSLQIYGANLEKVAAGEALTRPLSFRIGETVFHVKQGCSQVEIEKAVGEYYNADRAFYRSAEGQRQRTELKELMLRNALQSRFDLLLDSFPEKLAQFKSNALTLPELLVHVKQLAQLDALLSPFNLLDNFDADSKKRLASQLTEAGFNKPEKSYTEARVLSSEGQARWIIASAAEGFASGKSSPETASYADIFARELAQKEKHYLRAAVISDEILLKELSGGVNEPVRSSALRQVQSDGYKPIADWSPDLAQKYISETRAALTHLRSSAGLDTERMQAIEKGLARLDRLASELSADNTASSALEELQRLVDSGLRLQERDLKEKDRIQKELAGERFRQRLAFGLALGGTLVGAAVIGLLFVDKTDESDKSLYKRSKIGR